MPVKHPYYTEHKISLLYNFTVDKYNYLLNTSACTSLKQSEHIVSLHTLHIKTDSLLSLLFGQYFLMRVTSFWAGRLTANQRVVVKIMMWQHNPPPPQS